MSDYTLWLGDCLDKMSQIEDGSIDMILADLPYGATACKWDVVIPFEPLWKHYKRVIKRNGAIVLTASQPFTSILVSSNLEWFKYEWIIDKKKASSFLDASRKPLKVHESILIFANSGPIYRPQMIKGKLHHRGPKNNQTLVYGKFETRQVYQSDEYFPKSIIEFSFADTTKTLHPTQKPVALLEYLIKTYTNEGETVLDNTMGSGSTLEAAMRTGRKSIGIEKDPGYFEIASQRLARVAAELRGEFVPRPTSGKIKDLPMFEAMV